MCVLQGGTEWHSHKRAHRPRHALAEVVGVLVLANTLVPLERAALLREEAANAHAQGSASAAREQKIDGGSYKRSEMRIAKSDGGTRPSSRFPERSLRPNGGSTPAEAKPTRSELVGGPLWERTGMRARSARRSSTARCRRSGYRRGPCAATCSSHARVGWKVARR
jgi:hypothetical protein